MDFSSLLLAAQAGTTVWFCALSPDLVRLDCVADPVVPVLEAKTTAVVNGTRFPLDASRRWSVALWSPPTEFERVELLARATICYRSPGCEVKLTLPASLIAAR